MILHSLSDCQNQKTSLLGFSKLFFSQLIKHVYIFSLPISLLFSPPFGFSTFLTFPPIEIQPPTEHLSQCLYQGFSFVFGGSEKRNFR